ncbi:hypothetical protein [Prosthecobacter sp.]|uniref:hypothetical protein n=1 Tax=Prosthecobacter sp. TaxID=1965333 RepID=UPI002489261F|nr:hypothetical protein [Prosthecobacter sp.]MDI1313886.1 hypothetical protein [Prosthecobacter sp.]
MKTAFPIKSPQTSPSTQHGYEEFSPAGGPWLVRQSFLRAETVWLSSMLGAYFPSLPRVLDILNEGTQTNIMLGSAPGEALKQYCSRVGPLPIGIACVLVWRLAAELEALESFLPEAVAFVDPLSCRMGLWQQDFLQLFVDRFQTRPLGREEIASRVMQVCAMLIKGHPTEPISASVAAKVPSSLLTHLREWQAAGSTLLTLGQIKGLMLMATAAVTRGLRGSNMMSQLFANERWHPLLPFPRSVPHVYGRSEGSRMPVVSVRLSRLLAHRNRLTEIEVLMLHSRLREQAVAVPVLGLALDPEHILLRLPGLRESANDSKVLDIRLDSLAEFTVALESAADCLSLGRSPVVIREAMEPGVPFSDLRGDIDEQLSRLWQTLQDGTFSLSGYNMEAIGSRELPGQFFCYLGNAVHRVGRPTVPQTSARAVVLSPPSREPGSPAAEESVEAPSIFPFNTSIDKLPQHPMKMILITAGSGGTGKSTIARLIYELANFETRDDVAMFDCDALGNRDFQKISPDKIESMPIDNVDSMRRIVETAMEGKLVLADLPASCQDILGRDLNPEIIQSLRDDDGLHWLPIHPVTAKAATLPAIKQWRSAIFGDAPSIVVVSLKDGPVSSELLDEIIRPQDLVLRMPVLDQSLAAALDASNATWLDILEGRVQDSHRMFGNPLVKRQLRFKRKECEDALFPLLRRIIKDVS